MMLDYQHQLRTIQHGRVFRTIQYSKRFIVNPIKGVSTLNELPGLLKRVDIPPIPASKLPKPEDYLNQNLFAERPLPIRRAPMSLRYPNIKVAVIGKTSWLNTVAHAYNVEKAEWKELLRLGTDMLVVNHPEAATANLASQVIKEFEKAEVPIVCIVHEEKELSSAVAKKAKFILALAQVHTAAKKKYPKKTMLWQPSVKPLKHNPVDWPRHGSGLAVATDFDEIKHEPPKSLGAFQIFKATNDAECYEKVKAKQAVICEEKNFSSETAFISTFVRLLAFGIPTFSSGSKAARELLPDYPFSEKIAEEYDKLAQISARERRSIFWRREVIDKHSNLRRFEELLTKLDIPLRQKELISIVFSTTRPDYIEHALKNIEQQNYERKELIAVLHGDNFDIKKVQKQLDALPFPSKLIQRPKNSLFGDNLNLAVDESSGDLITKMDDDDYYGPNHLRDLHVALQYSGADVVGKWGNFVYMTKRDGMVDFQTDREEHVAHHLPGATILMHKDIFNKVRYGRIPRAVDSEMYRRMEIRGGTRYSTHRYNFIRVRHDDHTYKKDDEDFIANADSKVRNGLDLDASYV